MLNLKVSIDPNSGFCFGVVYAIQLAEEYLDDNGYLYCLGDIVHNDEEVARLRKKGLISIDHEQLKKLKNDTVLIRAHGEPPETYRVALQNNINLIDASCPVVLKLQNRVKNAYSKNSEADIPVFIYGKHGHAEVKGLMGQTGQQAVVFQDEKELDVMELPDRLSLFSQTTKDTHKLYNIKKKLESKGVEVQFNDTICRQVSNRDPQLREFATHFDKIIFVAGTKSSNGRVLYGVCKEVNPKTTFVSGKEELNPDWFEPGQTVGVCGATSTPMWLMEEVKNELEKW
jgi:4-hydroxy-3-methylbut-2-en-1-yl diphosphate reductase